MNDATAKHAQPMREKYWEECTDAEKIERLRWQLILALRENSMMAEVLHQMRLHRHGEDGSLLVPLRDPASNLAGAFGGPANHGPNVPRQLAKQDERERY